MGIKRPWKNNIMYCKTALCKSSLYDVLCKSSLYDVMRQ